ncbi:MAG: hypothetical protein M0R17_07030 [Candidatus Omnitrophica bacterium]|jgi:DNA-directed RNA polymerase subunit RPC12/RpoP|nr:hypothetical protein [Candidatus Omnitrophota bacterium]
MAKTDEPNIFITTKYECPDCKTKSIYNAEDKYGNLYLACKNCKKKFSMANLVVYMNKQKKKLR